MNQTPLILAIDCATLPASVAMVGGDGTLVERVHDDDRRSDAWIGDAIEAVLADVGAEVADLAGIAVSSGPGTFTGIRVGIATALGLAAPGSLPTAGISTLDALAMLSGPDAEHVLACIDARRQQVYAAWYEVGDPMPTPVWGPAVCAAADIPAPSGEPGATMAIGSGAPLAAEHFDVRVGSSPVPLAAAVGRLALMRWPNAPAGDPDWPVAEPVYLRPPDATPPQNPLLAARDRR